MAKNDIKDFDATASNNTDINSVNIAEGCPPSGINNAIRELMSDLKNALFAKINVTADTSAGDDAAIGYTAAEGLILTGQGSTNDVTIKNDADADVITIATGTTNVNIVGGLTATSFGGIAEANLLDKTATEAVTGQYTFTAPILGTPASGTATNITGLPAASVLAGTLGTGAYTISGELSVDNLNFNANTIQGSGAAPITITATAGQVVAVEGVSFDGGVVTGASSVTSTSLVGALTGNASTATALATPRAIGGVNFDGTAAITPANITIADESTDTTCFPLFTTAATGNLPPKSGSNLTFNSSTGILGATTFSGAGTSLTGTGASFTAGNVTTNANLTGHITSVGNAAVLGSFTSLQLKTALTNETGSGSAVFATSPTLVTPALGTPASGVATNITGLPAASVLAGTLGTGAYTISGSLAVDNITINAAVISSDTGAISFSNENLTTTGTVGIGTSSPSGKLDVELGATGIIAEFHGAGSDILQINSEGDLIALDTRNTTNGLAFQMQGTEVMRISTAGDVTIPAGALNVTNNTTGELSRISTTDHGTGSTYLALNRGGTTAGVANDPSVDIVFQHNDDAGADNNYGRVRVEISDPAAGAEDGRMELITSIAGTETIFLSSDNGNVTIPAGNLTVTGNITSSSSGGSALRMDTSDATYAKLIQYASSADVLALESLGSVQVSIDQNNGGTGATFKVIANGTSGTTLLSMDETGAMVLPLQPAFLAYNSATDSDVTGDGTYATVDFDTEVFDQGADFASDTFTAPVTGRYLLAAMARTSGITAVADSILIQFLTSNRNYISYQADSNLMPTTMNMNLSMVVDMDASDTASVRVRVSGEGSNVCDVEGHADMRTSFSGCLLA